MNLLEIADRAHSHAQKAGFLDSDRTSLEKLKDVQKEYMEALTALNNNHHVDWERFHNAMEKYGFPEVFKVTVKDTYEDELTDMLIVILCLMKDCKMDIQAHINMKMKYNNIREDH